VTSSGKAAAGALGLALVGIATLEFSPGAGRLPLGTMTLTFAIFYAIRAARLRMAGK
jgi:hypothetical protein